MKKYYAESELIINPDGSIFHLHIKPEQLANKIILVGDPGRVALVASHFDTKECEIESREFKTITGTYKGKRLTVVSTGIGCDNIDIVMNELDQTTKIIHYLMPSNALLAVALAGSIARILLQYSMDLSLLAFASAFNAGFSIANK